MNSNDWARAIVAGIAPRYRDPRIRRIESAVRSAQKNNGPVVLNRSEWDYLQASVKADQANTSGAGPQTWVRSPVCGLSVQIQRTKGYPTTITPRARKKRR